MRKIWLIFCFVALIFPAIVFARLGVGVGIGNITVDKILRAGQIYHLPSLPVINTGDQISDYELDITYHSKQEQLSPPKEWFRFEPELFTLEPGKSRLVDINLVMPMKAEPGDYFAYVEARPVLDQKKGTTIGIAAAAKLYFTVEPANLWQAIIYRISYFFRTYSPWTWIVLGILLAAVLTSLFKKYFKLDIGIKFKKKEDDKPEKRGNAKDEA